MSMVFKRLNDSRTVAIGRKFYSALFSTHSTEQERSLKNNAKKS